MYEITNKVSRKAPVNSTAPIRMISYGNGFILQSDKYSRDNAGESLKKYTLLKKGEMAYNHGASKNKKYGVCYSLKESDEARIPFVYHAFQINRGLPAFWNYALNISQIDKQLKKLVSSGARMDGLLNISYDDYMSISVYEPCVDEQAKISAFLSVIDKRIAVQNKIIEDLKVLKKELCNRAFSKGSAVRLGELIEEVTVRNKSNACDNVLSVSNKMGFIKQSEQFEDRTIASENKSSYKVVTKGCFAYNPARINVGSIALLSSHSMGIISPMYVCFKAKNVLDSTYLSFYYQSDFFARELQKKLEGSVRQCLTYENMREIIIPYVNIERQREIATTLNRFTMLIATEEKCLKALQKQKSYFLNAMFI